MTDDPANKPPDKSRPGAVKESGRVTFDSRGNPVWEWKESTGVFQRNISTQRLKKLEAKDLKLEETLPPTKKSELSVQEDGLSGGGFNPYNSGGLKSSSQAEVSHPALAHKQAAGSKQVSQQSLASKYANAARQKAEPPRNAWDKLKSTFKRDK